MTKQNRRRFLSDTFSSFVSFGVASAFTSLSGRLSFGETPASDGLTAVADQTTGLPLLRLPEGFSYRSYSWSGDPMSDGHPTPTEHDGMGVVSVDGPIVTMVRNHEISEHGDALPGLNPYDPQARGGCSTLKFDTAAGQWLESRTAITGTSRNCAGGVTPWGTWLTCEETVLGINAVDKYKEDAQRTFTKSHGWIFEVDPAGISNPVPLKAMGRFVHEAVSIDHETGIVYETEDRTTSGFYRFLPNTKGKLADGGTLQIAEVIGQPDVRTGMRNGDTFDVRWHTIADPELPHTPDRDPPDELGVFLQGKKLGATTFARLEGCGFGNGLVYFDATSGGDAGAGQIWEYNPATEKLTLLFESPEKQQLNMPDNLCVNPSGGIILCEDNDYGVQEYPQRVFSLSQDGKLTLVAQNNVVLNGEKNGFAGDFRNREWAGATFSPDGKWLFVNIQTPGISFAITGPWDDLLT